VDTVNVSLQSNPNAELLVSGGDQVDKANTEAQWTASSRPRSCAATRGSRRSATTTWAARPTSSTSSRPTPTAPVSTTSTATRRPNSSGGDYWFIHKDVLFIDLNSNSYKTPREAAATRRTSST
jgi:hypothetical protein